MQTTTIHSSPSSEWTFKSSEDGTGNGDSRGQPDGYPMFIANLNFKATEEHIITAFEERDIKVVRVELKKNQRGNHVGYGTLFLKDKEDVDRAVTTMDRMQILGRETFLSYFKEDKRPQRPKEDDKKPTLLVITDIPVEWRHNKKIENALSPYGHIKSISIQDKTEPYSVRVEFHMASDAANAYAQWQDGLVFQGIDLKIRQSFVGTKRLHPVNKNKGKNGKGTPRVAATSSNQGPDLGSAHFPVGPILPATQSRKPAPFAFIPHQVVRSSSHMRQRLEMPENLQERSPPEQTSQKARLEGEKAEDECEPMPNVPVEDKNSSSTENSPPSKKKKEDVL